MNWIKLAYHSFLTIVLGVTLSVCSNVMETDDFEIEAIASSSTVKYGSSTISSGDNTITFNNSFSSLPVISGLTEVVSGSDNCTGDGNYVIDVSSSSVKSLSKSNFVYASTNSCNGTINLKYVSIGN